MRVEQMFGIAGSMQWMRSPEGILIDMLDPSLDSD
jgi:hypothetical protein